MKDDPFMNDDLVMCIQANEFDDTFECIKWLVNRHWISCDGFIKSEGCVTYMRIREFDWTGSCITMMEDDDHIVSRYHYQQDEL